MVYKSLDRLAPDNLTSNFETEIAFNLRDSWNELNLPLPRTKLLQISFSYSGPII